MKHIIITAMIALICWVGPTIAQANANDAHHPEKKSVKSKKSVTKAPKQQKKKPAAKINKAS